MKKITFGIVAVAGLIILLKWIWGIDWDSGSNRLIAVEGKFAHDLIEKPQVPIAVNVDRSAEENDKDQASLHKVEKLQQALKNAGFDPGPIDGKMGSSTKKALANFKQANNLPRNSEIDDETMMELRRFFEVKKDTTRRLR